MRRLSWDAAKRIANLAKHGLDFAQAHWVLDSDIRLDLQVVRQGQDRTQSFAYVYDQLRVLTLVHVSTAHGTRIISYRAASAEERRNYHDWLAQTDP